MHSTALLLLLLRLPAALPPLLLVMANLSLCAVPQVPECQPAAPGGAKRDLMICKAMCLGIAYSSNIGGISTLPGTSPNLIFSEYMNQ